MSGYVSLKALAVYSGLSVRTLRGYLADRVRPLPHYRVGGKILVSRADFDAWVRQFRVQASAVPLNVLVDDVLGGLR
jgi:excisionase family DNA binding protein